jgi:hypothetical protein
VSVRASSPNYVAMESPSSSRQGSVKPEAKEEHQKVKRMRIAY